MVDMSLMLQALLEGPVVIERGRVIAGWSIGSLFVGHLVEGLRRREVVPTLSHGSTPRR